MCSLWLALWRVHPPLICDIILFVKVHAHTWYGDKVKLEVIGQVNGKRRLIKSDILPYDQAMADLKEKIFLTSAGIFDILPK